MYMYIFPWLGNCEDYGNIGRMFFNNMMYFSAIPQAADELREQEVRQKNDEIQQKSAQLEQIQVLNPVLMQVGCVILPIDSLFLIQQDHNMHDCGLP